MTKKQEDRAEPPARVPPTADDVVERLVGRRRSAAPTDGDVVLIRESIPTLKLDAASRARYRLVVHPATDGRTFDTFQHGAAAGELLASQRSTRLLYLERGERPS